MPRPRKCRRVGRVPVHTFYKPQGVPLEGLTGVNLSVEGLEAIRLVDAEGMDHETAAERMAVSRPTLSRMLAEARGVVARALSSGWAIHIDGGSYRMAGQPGPMSGAGRRCGAGGRGRRRPNGALDEEL
ncbi:MAG: DUF134 domain-containing protein [Desulfatitalea sp.]|nr:DUF134 domain-containing protein [Desulfatitalea sp.]NNK01639.1 DUF134 domain-containing protein [Desulfatitalea sp.]